MRNDVWTPLREDAVSTATKAEYHDLAMYEDGDVAHFWRISKDRFAMQWSCGNQYFFRFNTIADLVDALPSRSKVGVACIKLEGVDQDGDLSDFYAYKRDRKLIVVDNDGHEAVSVSIAKLMSTLTRVMAGPIRDSDPIF